MRRRKANGAPEALDAVLDKTFASLGLKKGADQWKVMYLWPQIVGKTVARLSRPIYVTSGILFVGTTSSGWAQELSFQKREILSRISAYLGEGVIQDIRFQGTLWERGIEFKKGRVTEKLNQQQAALVQDLVGSIESEKLKRVLEKLLTRWVLDQCHSRVSGNPGLGS